VELVLQQSPVLGRAHQTWMMTEVNKLVWGPPAPKSPLGRMDPQAFKQTAEIALEFGIIKKAADAGAYTHEIWEMARKNWTSPPVLPGTGEGFRNGRGVSATREPGDRRRS
jgi:NitT/TauT family transport system substrate-binding protein